MFEKVEENTGSKRETDNKVHKTSNTTKTRITFYIINFFKIYFRFKIES